MTKILDVDHSSANARNAPKPSSNDPDRLMTPLDTAGLLGVSERCLENWRLRGGPIPYVRISSRCVRYQRKIVLDFIASRTSRSTSDEVA